MVPVGFNERDKVLTGRGEVRDRLVRQHFQGATAFHCTGVVLTASAGPQVRDLVIQRCIHVQQCTGDIQEHAFVDLLLALDHAGQRVALLHDHASGDAQAHHAQRVSDRAQFIDLGLQLGRLAAGAQVQVQRILDAQQLFLDRIAYGVEQLAVASAQAATGMVQLGFGGAGAFRSEGKQHAFIDARRATRGTDFIEQRQQHDRDIAVTVLQALEVIGQQHAAAHQGGAGFVTVRHLARTDGVGQLLHFLGDHGRGIQLDHAQGALHLVQVTGAEAHAATVGRIFHEVLDLVAHLAQGLVQLWLDPAQGRMAHGIAQRAHAGSPGRWARMSCCDFSRCIIC